MLDTSYPGVSVDLYEERGWIMIQKKVRTSVTSFNQDWNAYRDGFGDAESADHNYWLGLEHVYRLTQLGTNKLKIEVGQCFTVYNICVEVHTVR